MSRNSAFSLHPAASSAPHPSPRHPFFSFHHNHHTVPPTATTTNPESWNMAQLTDQIGAIGSGKTSRFILIDFL